MWCLSKLGGSIAVVLVLVGSVLGSDAMAAKIAAGERQSCAVTPAGGAICWGQRSSGSLGDGLVTGVSYDPVPVKGLSSGVTAIAGTLTGNGGSQYACAIVSGGVKCWGTGGYGTLGNGKKESSAVPVQVTGLASGVTAISLNAVRACAIQSGAVKCWGAGGLGNDGNASAVPVQINGVSGATGIALGWRHSCLLAGGTVSCWGDGSHGSLGSEGNGNGTVTPRAVVGLPGPVSKIASGLDATCALVGGRVYCWGSWSLIGTGAKNYREDTSTPVQVKSLGSGVSDIVSNGEHFCALKGGTAWCWGENSNGQLGNGTLVDSTLPVQVKGLSGITEIAVSSEHTCALAGGATWCWGSNSGGQVGNEAAGPRPAVPVKVIGSLRLKIVARKARLDSTHAATVATINCPKNATCVVTGSKTINVRVAGKKQTLTLKVPSAIGAGHSGVVTVEASAAAAAALRGKTASGSVKLAISRNGNTAVYPIAVRISG